MGCMAVYYDLKNAEGFGRALARIDAMRSGTVHKQK